MFNSTFSVALACKMVLIRQQKMRRVHACMSSGVLNWQKGKCGSCSSVHLAAQQLRLVPLLLRLHGSPRRAVGAVGLHEAGIHHVCILLLQAVRCLIRRPASISTSSVPTCNNDPSLDLATVLGQCRVRQGLQNRGHHDVALRVSSSATGSWSSTCSAGGSGCVAEAAVPGGSGGGGASCACIA